MTSISLHARHRHRSETNVSLRPLSERGAEVCAGESILAVDSDKRNVTSIGSKSRDLGLLNFVGTTLWLCTLEYHGFVQKNHSSSHELPQTRNSLKDIPKIRRRKVQKPCERVVQPPSNRPVDLTKKKNTTRDYPLCPEVFFFFPDFFGKPPHFSTLSVADRRLAGTGKVRMSTTSLRKGTRQRRPPPSFNSSPPPPAAAAAAAKKGEKKARVVEPPATAVPLASDASAFVKAAQKPRGASSLWTRGVS